MAISRVGASQQNTLSGTANTTGITLTRAATTTGNLLIVSAYFADVTQPQTISDSQGNTWNVCNPDFIDGVLTRMQSWYAIAKNTSSTTVTVKSTSTGTAFMGMTLEEFTGNSATPLDQVNHSLAGASGTNPTGPSITLGANDCLVWALYVDTSTTPFVGSIDGSTATLGSNDSGGDVTEHRILTGRSGVSVSASFTGSGTYEIFIASFKPSAGASLPVGNGWC